MFGNKRTLSCKPLYIHHLEANSLSMLIAHRIMIYGDDRLFIYVHVFNYERVSVCTEINSICLRSRGPPREQYE
jgi:hypothetical protein